MPSCLSLPAKPAVALELCMEKSIKQGSRTGLRRMFDLTGCLMTSPRGSEDHGAECRCGNSATRNSRRLFVQARDEIPDRWSAVVGLKSRIFMLSRVSKDEDFHRVG